MKIEDMSVKEFLALIQNTESVVPTEPNFNQEFARELEFVVMKMQQKCLKVGQKIELTKERFEYMKNSLVVDPRLKEFVGKTGVIEAVMPPTSGTIRFEGVGNHFWFVW